MPQLWGNCGHSNLAQSCGKANSVRVESQNAKQNWAVHEKIPFVEAVFDFWAYQWVENGEKPILEGLREM